MRDTVEVFCDESADEKKRRVFAFAGVIGSEDVWAQLITKWLARTNGIPFHANHCDSDRGAYATRLHVENKALYRDLVTFVAESGLGGWAFVIDLAAQQEVFPGSLDLAYYRGLVELLTALRNFGRYNTVRVRFTFDSRAESEHNARMLFNTIHSEGNEFKEWISPEVSFVSSRAEPRLQVADLFAREAMKTYDNRFGHQQKRRAPRKSWLALRDTGRFHIDAIGCDYLLNLKANMSRLQEITGMQTGDYLEWLRQHGNQHNVTNQLRYMASKGPSPANA